MICTPFLQLILRMYYPIAITRLHDSNGLFLWPIFGDLAYRSTALEKVLAGTEVLLVTERSRQNGKRQHTGIALASLKRGFRLGSCWRRHWWGSSPGSRRRRSAPTPTPS